MPPLVFPTKDDEEALPRGSNIVAAVLQVFGGVDS